MVVADPLISCYGHEMDDRDDQLDGLRIRQLSTLRRATYRSRSHAIIAAGVCAVAGVQFGILMVGQLRTAGFGLRAVIYGVCSVLAAIGVRHFIGRARRLNQELKLAKGDRPSAEPNFTTLGDGGDLIDKLENIE